MKKQIAILILLTSLSQFLSAGDIARFVNLGFSDNSKYFMFGQYGIDSETSTPYAETYIVNAPANKFTTNGVKKVSYTTRVEPGDSGDGALFKVLEDTLSLQKNYGIDHLLKGRILYLLLNGQKPKSIIEFRDFNSGNKYKVILNQSSTGSGKSIASRFHINLEISLKSGGFVSKVVGHSAYKRKGVKSYKIRQIIIAPDEASLIFIIEKEEENTEGIDIRYMVETVKIN